MVAPIALENDFPIPSEKCKMFIEQRCKKWISAIYLWSGEAESADVHVC